MKARSSSKRRVGLGAFVLSLLLALLPASAVLGAGEVVVVKLKEGSGARLRDGAFTVATELAPQVGALEALVSAHAPSATMRVFSTPEEELAERVELAREISRRSQPDLNLYFKFRFDTAERAEAFRLAVGELPLVEHAYIQPEVTAPILVNLESQQDYLETGADGTGAKNAWNFTGGAGAGITIVDVEWGWNLDHEDLSKATSDKVLVPSGKFYVSRKVDHGTSVLGMLVGDDNGIGVTGIVKDADILMSPVQICCTGGSSVHDVADAISRAVDELAPGDVILLEVQWSDETNLLPVEYCAESPTCAGFSGICPCSGAGAEYAAIVNATALGITVVEAAANGISGSFLGGKNLDTYSRFDRDLYDSGAILVGAGYPDEDIGACFMGGLTREARSRMPFSNYGSRVDLQGWGSNVVTTGYGDHAASGSDEDEHYSRCFDGTSAASPMVAAAAAAVQGRRKAVGEPVLSPLELRELLRVTGKPQADSAAYPAATNNIGPLVDIEAAVRAAGTPPEITGVAVDSTLGCFGFPNRQWVTIEGTGFISIAEVILNDGSEDFPIEPERTEFESATEINVCAGVAQAPSWTARVENLPGMVSPPWPFTGGGSGGGGVPVVTTTTASNVSQTAASLNMIVDPNGDATVAWFEWGSSSSLGEPPTPAEPVGSGSGAVAYSRTISGLTCDEDYYFRARASNGEGSATPGTTLSFSTDSCSGGGGTEEDELIRNGGFEDDDQHWVRSGDFYADDRFGNPHFGSGYAYLSESDGSPGNGLYGWITQGFDIPADSTEVTARFWYSISTTETSTTTEFDTLTVAFYEAGDSSPHVPIVLSNLDDTGGSYVSASFDLSAYAGKSIQLYFVGETDYWAPDPSLSNPTVFRIDDVSVEATVPTGDPPHVTTEAADQITATTARLNLTVDPGGLPTDVWFEWDDDPNLSFDTDPEGIGGGSISQTYSYTLTGLDCDTRYYFEAFAENSQGEDDGATRQFVTAACPGGPPRADTDPADSITRTSARLTAEIDANGLASQAWFEWGPTDALGLETPHEGVGSSFDWVDFDETLSGLTCGTTYYFEAHAENDAGHDDGTTHSFATLACDPGNQAPLTGIDSYFTPIDQTLSIPAPGVLGNDTDPEDDPLTAHLVAGPANGTVTLSADGSFVYSPSSGFAGDDTFTYRANDGLLDSAITSVSISVGAPPPILWPDTIDLETAPGTEPVPVTRIWGQLPGGNLGRDMAAGDFNGDGLVDLLLGAENAEPLGREDAGAAYVIWGSTALANQLEVGLDGGGVTAFYGETDEELGSCVAAGDIDGDGVDDIILGAETFRNGTRSRAGKVYVVYGQGSLPALVDMESTGVARTELLGPGSNHYMGRSCGAGDLNGDGRDDILAGASTTDFGDLSDVGKFFVVYGSANLGATVNLRDVAADIELWGAGDNDEVGREVTAGDLDDDGFDDLILSGSGTTNREHVYVLWGGPSLPAFQDLSSSLAGITKILGPPQGSFGMGFGRPVGTGDVDGDGGVDLLVGAPDSEALCPDSCGTVFVIYGATNLPSLSTLDLGVTPGDEAALVTRIHGLTEGGLLGASVASGDFNNDGTPDLVVGASGFGSRETVFAIPGRPELRLFVETVAEDEAFESTSIRSPIAGIGMGRAAALGDLNGDGFDDVLIGAYSADPAAGTNAGAAFIVYGGVKTLSSPFRTLSVNVVGNGQGSVTSTPAGESCSDQCQSDYFVGSEVGLAAAPGTGSVFDRWVGAGCSGGGACSVTLDSDLTVAALFIEPDFCGSADTLELYGMRVASAETFEACSHLSAGDAFIVDPSGAVTLRSGGRVVLEDGAVIAGELVIESEAPDLMP